MTQMSSHGSRLPASPPMRGTASMDTRKYGARWHEQRRKRSHILSVFLGMLNARDADDINLGDIAAAAGVAVQTIYNLVGNRSELIGAAIEEWGNAVSEFARHQAELNAQNPVMMSLQVHWSAVIAQHGFVLRTARLTYSSENLQQWAWGFAMRAFLEDLKRIDDAGGIVPGIHLPTLARQMSYASNCSVSSWLLHPYGVENFRRDLIHGPGLMLAGALVGEELEKLRHSLDCWSRGSPDLQPIPGMPI